MTDQLPVFATNDVDTGETVAASVNRMYALMRETLKDAPPISIASAYVNAGGFTLLADELEQAPYVRLLLGAEPDATTDQPARHDGAGTAEEISSALVSHDMWLQMQRNLLGFTRESSAAAQRLLAWLSSNADSEVPRVEVRRYTQGFLHGKCYLVTSALTSATLAGSSNFTYAGLSRNAELNLGANGSPGHVALVEKWFDRLWGESEAYDLAAVYSVLWEPHSPWQVFLRMLYELYGSEPDEEAPRTELSLTGFQLDGVARMLRLLESHGGVLVADEVGLGKTYLAGEVIARATKNDRQKVLIVAPASLKTGMWEPFLTRFDFSRRVVVYSYDELRLRSDPEQEGSENFLRELDDYAMVVVDEAHNLRNPGAQRSAVVSSLVGGSRPKKVVLLTATPVNNSLMDLHTLISYFVRNDAAFTNIGIPSVRGYIKHAQSLDPESLSPEHLFDLMDEVAVRRTRRFVQRYYEHDTILMPDGTRGAISFPTPAPKRIDYTLDASGDALLNAVVYALDLPGDTPLVSKYQDRHSDPSRLMLARYTPSAYALHGDLESHQVSNVGLLRSALLKRLESSSAALVRTLNTLIASHELFLAALDKGYVMTSQALRDWSGSEDEDLDQWVKELDEDLAEKVTAVSEYQLDALRTDVSDDLTLLGQLRDLAVAAASEAEPKADELIAQLREIGAEARRVSRDGLGAEDRRKVLVFSTFADTIDDLWRRVSAAVDAAPPGDPLSDYQGRVAEAIKGQSSGADQQHRARVLASFAPNTAGPLDSEGKPTSEDKYDLLLTTDVLSEGVNLQQCGRIINYDLPWNPMRLVQRHGRVDRIGSKHSRVMLGCFFPSKHLDQLLGLEETLKRKLAYADAAIGVGDVLPGAAGRFEVNLGDTRDQIEAIKAENPEIFINGGSQSAALSGEEYRKRLQRALDNPMVRKQVTELPWMVGSGFVNPNSSVSGYVFCMRMGSVRGSELVLEVKPWFRFIPVDDETWEPLIEIPDGGSEWSDTDAVEGSTGYIVEADTLSCLMAADPGGDETERVLPDLAYDKAFDAWSVARDAALADWLALTDPNALKPDVPKALRDAMELVYEVGSQSLSPDEQGELLARLNSAPPNRVVKEVRAVLNGESVNSEKVLEIREIAEQSGLTPSPPGDPLPVIGADDVHLIAWMAVRGRGDS